MNTLIELYDDRPLENVLAAEVYRPDNIFFLCPTEVIQNKTIANSLLCFFKKRGVSANCIFLETSLLYADKVKKQLEHILHDFPDSAIDITGGSEAALFASGLVAADSHIPAFTYSRKKNRFYEIQNASFIGDGTHSVQYDIHDIFLMAGGSDKEGRVNNKVLKQYFPFISELFEVYQKHRREWQRSIDYFQHVSTGDETCLSVCSPFKVKGEHGAQLEISRAVLNSLEKAQGIKDLNITTENNVSFTFYDKQIKYWLRDVGSVLELYVYKACVDSALFQEVRTSVIVNWDKGGSSESVQNEIDVVAVSGIMPVFISCKTCAASTEALNELAILRNRFGGSVSKACLVTAMPCRSVTRHRAAELGIVVLDWEDIKDGLLKDRLKEYLAL